MRGTLLSGLLRGVEKHGVVPRSTSSSPCICIHAPFPPNLRPTWKNLRINEKTFSSPPPPLLAPSFNAHPYFESRLILANTPLSYFAFTSHRAVSPPLSPPRISTLGCYCYQPIYTRVHACVCVCICRYIAASDGIFERAFMRRESFGNVEILG